MSKQTYSPLPPGRMPSGQIKMDIALQSRVQLCLQTVDEYAELLHNPDFDFPPVVVFFDGESYWLADGYHRVAAYGRQYWRLRGVPVDVRPGTKRDAMLYSFGANGEHGLRRTDEDKRRVVIAMLRDPEWGQWSDSEIAKRCHVSHPFVGKLRAEVASCNVSRCAEGAQVEPAPAATRTAKRNGKTYTVNTARIGKRAPASKAAPPPRSNKSETHEESEERLRLHAETDARSSTLKELAARIGWFETFFKDRTDEDLAWFTIPNSPGLIDHGVTSERVNAVAAQLQRCAVHTFGAAKPAGAGAVAPALDAGEDLPLSGPPRDWSAAAVRPILAEAQQELKKPGEAIPKSQIAERLAAAERTVTEEVSAIIKELEEWGRAHEYQQSPVALRNLAVRLSRAIHGKSKAGKAAAKELDSRGQKPAPEDPPPLTLFPE